MGVLPQALFNFLLLLGWNPGGDRELISLEEAAEVFDLSDVNKAPAVFDVEKLLWMNGQYMMRMSAAELAPALRPFLPPDAPPPEALAPAIELNKGRARTLRELANLLDPYLSDDRAIDYEPDAIRKHLKGEDLQERMRALYDTMAAVEPFDVNTSELALRGLAERSGIGAGKYIHPFRVALTGRLSSPPIFDVAVTLGKERSLRRLQRLIERLPEL